MEKLLITLARQKDDNKLFACFYFFKKNYKLNIEKSDDLLKIIDKVLKDSSKFKNVKLEVKFEGGVGMLNKRIAKAIIKTINLFK